MSAKRGSIEYRKAMSESLKKARADPKWRKKHSRTMKKYWDSSSNKMHQAKAIAKSWERRSEEEKKSIGVRITEGKLKAYADGKNKPSLINYGSFVDTRMGVISCQGKGDEEMWASIFDLSKAVKKFKKDYPRIPYKYEGKQHTYFPDFYVKLTSGQILVLEIKARRLDSKDAAKIKAARKYCRRKKWKFILVSRERD